LERRKDTGRPHVVADDGRGGTSSGTKEDVLTIFMRRFVAPRRAVTVPHGVVVRRGCFPAGTGMVLLEGSVGIVHAPARGVPVMCLLAGWNLGRGNDGGLGMVGAVTGAVLMVGG
jgi:hypothetical protein